MRRSRLVVDEDLPPVERYFDRNLGLMAAKIGPGEWYATAANEVIVTVLGSCVSACVRDTTLNVGAMNHFMLPEKRREDVADWNAGASSSAMRYGNHAMECLVNALLRRGADRRRFEVKIFGGGRMLSALTDIGAQNIEFVRQWIGQEGLTVAAEDVGEDCPRKVYYFPSTGRVLLRRLERLHNNTLLNREAEYRSKITEDGSEGSVELFG
jgi:chemotaxis protein CheD